MYLSLLFGDSSHQPSSSNYNDPSYDLFGAAPPSGKSNYLFSTLNSNPGGGAHTNAWTIDKAEMDTHGNPDAFHSEGFSATFSTSMEHLMACQDYLGHQIASTSVDTATGDTIYTLLGVGHTAYGNQAGRLELRRMGASCTETTYTLRVSNTIYALSGVDSNKRRNAYYITDASYADADSTGAICDASTCDSTIGLEHPCPSVSELANTQIKSLEYKINLTCAIVASTTSGTTTTLA